MVLPEPVRPRPPHAFRLSHGSFSHTKPRRHEGTHRRPLAPAALWPADSAPHSTPRPKTNAPLLCNPFAKFAKTRRFASALNPRLSAFRVPRSAFRAPMRLISKFRKIHAYTSRQTARPPLRSSQTSCSAAQRAIPGFCDFCRQQPLFCEGGGCRSSQATPHLL
jgi:hypothetical protein